MASTSKQVPDSVKLYKFTRLLTLKLAQVVVQSRQGTKVTQEVNAEVIKNHPSQESHWFNLCIPDDSQVLHNAKQVLNGEIVAALSNVLCIEISLQTSEGEEVVLEQWSVRMLPETEPAALSTSAVYYRMSTILKSTLSISRVTPAYKLCRQQHQQSYKINYRIFGGQPNADLVGKAGRHIKVSELRTGVGTILVELAYRSELALSRSTRAPAQPPPSDIMLVSNHFPNDNPKKEVGKVGPDLSRPLTLGAFAHAPAATGVQPTNDKQQAEKRGERVPAANGRTSAGANGDGREVGAEEGEGGVKKPGGEGATATRAIDVPTSREQKYVNLMDFPFAGGSPISELANFYQECLQARGVGWEEDEDEEGGVRAGEGEGGVSPTNSDLSDQLRQFEEAVPEFDDMVQAMFAEQQLNDTP